MVVKVSDNVGMVLIVLCAMVVLLVGKMPEADVVVVLTAMSLVILMVVEVVFLEKTKEVSVSFELLAVSSEVLAGLATRVKELIVMSG